MGRRRCWPFGASMRLNSIVSVRRKGVLAVEPTLVVRDGDSEDGGENAEGARAIEGFVEDAALRGGDGSVDGVREGGLRGVDGLHGARHYGGRFCEPMARGSCLKRCRGRVFFVRTRSKQWIFNAKTIGVSDASKKRK